jgi:hypothetical protein
MVRVTLKAILLLLYCGNNAQADTNPFEKGCLHSHGLAKIRVCNTDDPADAAERGVCREPEFDYLEVRLYPMNWESTVFEGWLLQIVLSELLGVPASVENGSPDSELNFYHPENAFKYGPGIDEERALDRAYEWGGDCTMVNRDPEAYETCSHVNLEIWERTASVNQKVFNGSLEFPGFIGLLGENSWFVTKFTAVEHPEVVSYLGLMGEDEENRQKLADMFLRPTSWKDYCEQVSPDLCESDDGVAIRAPLDESEKSRFFVQDLYTGHFRKTDENDCVTNPKNCTGHIGDYPCGWLTRVEGQCHHLGIPLRSSGDIHPAGRRGYSYARLVEMWQAANATKSNLMMMWWTPESLYQTFAGTDAAFQKVLMPPPTQECIDNRALHAECSDILEERVGAPEGTCGEASIPLEKHISESLFDAIYDSSIPEALRNPGHTVLSQFSITALQLDEMFAILKAKGSMREAMCDWASENMDYLETLVPREYPRVQKGNEDNGTLLYASTFLGGLATFVVLVIAWRVHIKREKRALRLAQLDFLWMLLFGLFLISVGAIVQGINPTNSTCVASRWLVNLGRTMELVPLILKVGAINLLMNAANSFKRVNVDRKDLFRGVAVVGVIVVIFLITWTVLDPPRKVPEYSLSGVTREDGTNGVDKTYYCSSESEVWGYIAVGWNSLLLFCAMVLAFQTRKIQKDFNESQTLAIMIYSHFVFVIMRIVTFALSGNISNSLLNRFQSMLFSADTLVTIAVYFVPKLTSTEDLIRHGSVTNFEHGGDFGANPKLTKPCSNCGFNESYQAMTTQERENQSKPPSSTGRDSSLGLSSVEETDGTGSDNREPTVGFSLAQEMAPVTEEQLEFQGESGTPVKE